MALLTGHCRWEVKRSLRWEVKRSLRDWQTCVSPHLSIWTASYITLRHFDNWSITAPRAAEMQWFHIKISSVNTWPRYFQFSGHAVDCSMSLITRHLYGILCYNTLAYLGRWTDQLSGLLHYIFKWAKHYGKHCFTFCTCRASFKKSIWNGMAKLGCETYNVIGAVRITTPERHEPSECSVSLQYQNLWCF